MDKRDFESLKRRVLHTFKSGDPGYERAMDDASVRCSEAQWSEILAALDAAEKELAAAPPADLPADPPPIPRGITFAEFRAAVGMPPREQEQPAPAVEVSRLAAENRALRRAVHEIAAAYDHWMSKDASGQRLMRVVPKAKALLSGTPPAEERALRPALEALLAAAGEAAPILLEDASCAELLGRLTAALAGARAALAGGGEGR